MDTVAVIDFETTGLSPDMGDRATEVAIVIVNNGNIADRYQSLMNAGVRIPAFIESLTGISNAMIRKAPPAAEVMHELAEFVGDVPLVAHNASSIANFWMRSGRGSIGVGDRRLPVRCCWRAGSTLRRVITNWGRWSAT